MSAPVSTSSLRERVSRGEVMHGSFVKFSDPSSVEIFGGAGFDFVVIDQEHGVFDRTALNLSLLACRAAAIHGVVRVPHLESDAIAAALDSGAAGILAPHVATAADARSLVAACRYRNGRRGFSGVTRAGGYGANPMWQHIDAADAGIAVIAMIEDPAALDKLADILAVEGLDAVFIGRGDLTVAFGAASRNDAIVAAAVDRIIDAARRHGKPVWVMVDSGEEVEEFLARGASSFIISSDQSMLRKAAVGIVNKLRKPA